ncbi:1-(5-phosphoribosyl)-5-amino-4-imidazole-carboxylate carboxylase [Campylobacter concisus]|uniref:nickel pincer cofactor biosynthesis protein LarB n=1 Tax=Campylobacter concisus TaxID=199 RepID=UPI000B3D688E|nr:nickel pincer cofactor biosynthesis protein LarB [Campylobacter concisus]OUT15729.1 1-(5-phosphoribosyl)-5-amino-4-imidazole-carboxylate carboxylase [Campylobacter concisus]
MREDEILELFAGIKSGRVSEQEALKYLKNYPYEDVGCAKIDTQRALRNGAGEVIYGEGKTDDEILRIASAIGARGQNILITRTNERVFKRMREALPQAEFNARGRIISVKFKELELTQSYIAIVSAGTADGAVVEEAYETARFLGNDARKFSDAGVAGLHRLIANLEQIRGAKVVIAVAGMEGALASVLAGLVSVPVIAVPTSVGYGASFGGLAALLAMLNSCANGVSVVNIDNGFGAAYNASLINHL